MKISKLTFLLLVLALVFGLGAYTPVDAGQLTGYDLVAGVNAYRASQGYYAIGTNALVMAAAQSHADWIVQTGQGSHTGAGGSDETMRVSWTGYGGGAEIKCDEAYAINSSIEDAIYSAWSDPVHQEVMLNGWGNRYTDAGGGVADWGNGLYVFVYDECLVVGQSSSGSVPSANPNTGATSAVQPTADLSNYVYGVSLATPQADGSIQHTVLNGQTLTSIAKAYGITVEQLRKLNNMAADDSNIWVGQTLVIQPAGSVSPTTAPQASATPAPVAAQTNAQAIEQQEPTATRIAQAYVPQRTATPAGAQAAAETESSSGDKSAYRVYGILLVTVSAIGLAAILYFSSRR